MTIDPAGMVGTLLVALANWFFMKRWIDSVDARLKANDEAHTEMKKDISSGKTRAILLQQALQIKGCLDGSECPSDDRDSTPPLVGGRHHMRA